MTQNQLAYLNYLEDRRHNMATEADTDVANAERERDNRARLEETNRSNLVAEEQRQYDLNTKAILGTANAITGFANAGAKWADAVVPF